MEIGATKAVQERSKTIKISDMRGDLPVFCYEENLYGYKIC